MYWNKVYSFHSLTLTRLIETWDVLKWDWCSRVFQSDLLINRNMRCIEIIPRAKHIMATAWLIETWDVLKFHRARVRLY